ncbi:hypothetical protein BGZ99_002528 [Dissophora globulifera]|uniref:DDE-1 domain-containing protein n=1 Tax=Dissophora globulifera TaxID=979702 RepID=A0A9P6UJ32_9FUNG|nr:hypothetical protein BGZ99_002528 [Dissophora globulifera]
MNNALGHGNTDDLGLKNIDLIRLPPKTTSVTQPPDAGIIRSFKKNSDRVKIPNGLLWPYLIDTRNDVTKSVIRNCIAHVPTVPDGMKRVLRSGYESYKDDTEEQVEEPKQELIQFYPGRAEAIKSQSDFGALAYLRSCADKGPSMQLTEIIRAVAASKEFKGIFMPLG